MYKQERELLNTVEEQYAALGVKRDQEMKEIEMKLVAIMKISPGNYYQQREDSDREHRRNNTGHGFFITTPRIQNFRSNRQARPKRKAGVRFI